VAETPHWAEEVPLNCVFTTLLLLPIELRDEAIDVGFPSGGHVRRKFMMAQAVRQPRAAGLMWYAPEGLMHGTR
jgi:hypothetical protein